MIMAISSFQVVGATSADAHHRHHRAGAAVAAGIIGLTAGAIIAGAASQPRYVAPRYYRAQPVPPRVYYRQAPTRYQAWTPQWYAYCARKYRSFNPNTGYFLAYSGQYRFCR